MPQQLYDKERILDACLPVFARFGYENASTGMLAEAAGVSKALLFHHFGSKKELYLNVLERSLEKMEAGISTDVLRDFKDFFEAADKASRRKVKYFFKNPDAYRIGIEAFYATPEELVEAIREKYGKPISERNGALEQLFERVPLKEGVDRRQAFELVMAALDYVEKKYLIEAAEIKSLDQSYLEEIIDRTMGFLKMIRYGIER